MSPADIRATEQLLERRPGNADPPPLILLDFLDASRARTAAHERLGVKHDVKQRILYIVIALALLGVVVSLLR
jgi:hypothetical protein